MRKTAEDLCLALKAKWRDLVKVGGGTDHASALVGVGISRISDYGSPEHMDRYPRIDQITQLELDCGMPVFTRYLADLHGYDLVQREARSERGIHSHFTSIVTEVAELQTRMAAAMADGTITDQERADIAKEAQEAANALQAMIAEFRAKPSIKAVK